MHDDKGALLLFQAPSGFMMCGLRIIPQMPEETFVPSEASFPDAAAQMQQTPAHHPARSELP